MIQFALPIVAADASVDDAIATMRTARVRAVVVPKDQGHAVVNLVQLLETHRTKGHAAAHEAADDDHMPFAALYQPKHEPDLRVHPTYMNGRGNFLRVVSTAGSHAVVESEFEWLAQRTSEPPIICICEVNHRHRFTPEQLTANPGYCLYDPAKVDCT